MSWRSIFLDLLRMLDSSARSRDEMINILWFELAAEQEELNS